MRVYIESAFGTTEVETDDEGAAALSNLVTNALVTHQGLIAQLLDVPDQDTTEAEEKA